MSSRDDLVSWLDSHTNWESAVPGPSAIPTLERIGSLCRILGDPQLAFRVIHLTGTNGKGSTLKIIAELLDAYGLSVGTYTSPDLGRVNERIARAGDPISDEDLAEQLSALAGIEPMLDARPTRFELLTAAAFRWFADIAVDVAVVEVGVGGRWDATNVVQPEVAAITNVSYDHVEILGPELTDIAREKAGIIKRASHVVVGETRPELVDIFRDVARRQGAAGIWVRGADFACDSNRVAVGGRLVDLRTPGEVYKEIFLSMRGAHQGDNAACALACVEAFFGRPVPHDMVVSTLGAIEMPGRLEVVGHEPLVLLDGAHNVAGMETLATSLEEEVSVDGTTVLVVGMLGGRDPIAMLRPLGTGSVRSVVACTAPSPRAQPAEKIAAAATSLGFDVTVAGDVGEALDRAVRIAGPDGMVVVAGSLYVVAEARTVLVP